MATADQAYHELGYIVRREVLSGTLDTDLRAHLRPEIVVQSSAINRWAHLELASLCNPVPALRFDSFLTAFSALCMRSKERLVTKA